MKSGSKPDWLAKVTGTGRPFIQPLAVAFVCIIFISLTLSFKLMDLRALDRTLVAYMENRGLSIINNAGEIAKNYFFQMVQTPPAAFPPFADPSFAETSLVLQESLIENMIELTQDIDLKWEALLAEPDQLASLSAREGLQSIVFLDEQGTIAFNSGPVPKALLSRAVATTRGPEEIDFNIFDRRDGRDAPRFIALRRQSGNGAIILTMDEQGFQYRCLKVSMQKAIGEIGENSDMRYMTVRDLHHRLLGSAGNIPEMKNDDIPAAVISLGKAHVTSKKIDSGPQKLLEIIAIDQLIDGYWIRVRLGITRDSADNILIKSRQIALVSMGFMAAIALFSMGFLYKNQNRHLAKMQEMERRIDQAERLSSLGRLAAGVAHEIRNPLNAVSMAIQRLQADNLDRIKPLVRDEIRRLDHIIDEFLSVSVQRLQLHPYDLTEFLAQIVFLLRAEAASRQITIQTRWHDVPVRVFMDADKMKQAFVNIIKNALESMRNPGVIGLATTPDGEKWACIKISDTGIGMSPEVMEHIFDPDYTTKEKGLGLGLTIAHEIICGHGGNIRVSSKVGLGTTFEIRLPRDKPQI
ncbi:MAG: ATP-binding protein [Desulfobacterales bacterium]|nr:ATP-binding protein [Desulfobacterales bacterium]